VALNVVVRFNLIVWPSFEQSKPYFLGSLLELPLKTYQIWNGSFTCAGNPRAGWEMDHAIAQLDQAWRIPQLLNTGGALQAAAPFHST